MQKNLKFTQEEKIEKPVPETIRENIMIKSPTPIKGELDKIYLRHNFFGYFVLDFINFIESDHRDLFYF